MIAKLIAKLPDGSTRTLEGVSTFHQVPPEFWAEIADVFGLPGVRLMVSCGADRADCQFGEHDRQFVWRHKVRLYRSIEVRPGYYDCTNPSPEFEVVRFEDYAEDK